MKPGSFNLLDDKSLVEFGKLVKAWSTGNKKRPITLSDFKEQLDSAKINYNLSEDIRDIHLHDREEGIFSILLPLKSRLENSNYEESENADYAESENSNGNGAYPIPRGYSRLQINTTCDPGEIEDIHGCKWNSFENYEELDDFRVGDYCSSQCA